MSPASRTHRTLLTVALTQRCVGPAGQRVAKDFSPENLGDWMDRQVNWMDRQVNWMDRQVNWMDRQVNRWSTQISGTPAYLHVFRTTSIQFARSSEDGNRLAGDAVSRPS